MLEHPRVVHIAGGVPAAYCAKLLADGGADVVLVEPPDGAPMRRYAPPGVDLAGADGALFRYLHTSQRSVVGDYEQWLAAADIVVTDRWGAVDVDRLMEEHPALVVVTISPFGWSSAWSSLPVTDFTLQAWTGSLSVRGVPEDPPVAAAGRIGAWMSGITAAVGGLAALRRVSRDGVGDHVDISELEAMVACFSQFQPTYESIAGFDRTPHSRRRRMVPSIVPTADGWVGFTLVTGAQIQDFFSMIGRQDWAEEPSLLLAVNRSARAAELLEVIEEWTRARTADEVVELAALYRLPGVRVERPETVTAVPHFVASGFFVDHPDGSFLQPGVPYRIQGRPPAPLRRAPAVGSDAGNGSWGSDARVHRGNGVGGRPLTGTRVLDLTRLWSGPMATQVLAGLGADVVRVESALHPDPFRLPFRPPGEERWYEWGPVFHALNTGKRSVGIDPTNPGALDVLRRLAGWADLVIENFTPRVMTQLGLDWDEIRRLNPRAVMVRMPAFGLDGPWRDRPGFAPTMEQLSGLTHLTGWPDGRPVDPYGTGDPVASMHTVFAVLLALEQRDRTGCGTLVEVPLICPTLSAAADAVIEWSAYGTTASRQGNRNRHIAPQGVYPCAGPDEWIAISIETDAQWRGLLQLVASPPWAAEHLADDLGSRQAAHDEIDRRIATWSAGHNAAELARRLGECGVPAAPVLQPNSVLDVEPIRDRLFYSTLVEHPVIGTHPLPSPAVHLASIPRPPLRTAAPTFGQHNAEVLTGDVGLTEDEVRELLAIGALRTTIG